MRTKMPLYYLHVVFDFPEKGTSPIKEKLIQTKRRVYNSGNECCSLSIFTTLLPERTSRWSERNCVCNGFLKNQGLLDMKISMIQSLQTLKPDSGNLNLKL